jgi:CelD/BcsL family acetyltransferase involved in cellulose biosynthesis
MPVEWVTDPLAFTTLDWTSLVEADTEGTFFHTPRFLKLYWEEFGAEHLRIAFVRSDEEPEAVAAFDVREGTLTFLGGFDLTDYMGPVGMPAARERAAKELMAAVASLEGWDRADLRGLRQDGRWLPALVGGAAESGLSPQVATDGVAPYLQLPETFDGYLSSLQSKRRHEIRRKERRLRESFPDAHLVDSSPDTVADDLDRFVELHRSSAGQKGTFMVSGMELFFRRLAAALLPDGTFRLAFLQAGGNRIAGAVGFRDRTSFRLYNSAYEHRQGPVAPGLVLVAELIKSAIEEGCEGFDFLKGDLEYKYRFGPRPHRIAKLLLDRR